MAEPDSKPVTPAPATGPSEPMTDADHLKLIESDLHFRVSQLRNIGVDWKLARGLMKAAFERFLIADEAADKARADARPWDIHIGDREVAARHGDPVLGRVSARTRVEAEKLAAGDAQIAIALGNYGVPRGVGFWAVEIKQPAAEAAKAPAP